MRNEMKPACVWRIKTLVFILLISVIGFVYVKSGQEKHSVVNGDTLWDIAGAYYKNPWQWKKIWNANRDLIGNPDLIYPAQVFSIPDLAKVGINVPKAESAELESAESADEGSVEDADEGSVEDADEGSALEEEIMAELEAEVEDIEGADEESVEDIDEISAFEEELVEELEDETTGEMEVEVEDIDEVSALEEELAEELEGEVPEEEVEDIDEISALEEELAEELEGEVPEEEVEDADEVSALEAELEEAVEEEIPEEPEEVVEEIEEEEIIEPVVTEEIDWDADSFVVPRGFSFDGKIIRDKERKILISQMDTVYLNVGTKQGLEPDAKCYVLRKIGTVKSGYLIKKVGMVKATSAVSEHTSTAIVIKSYEPIRVSDLIQVIE